MKIITSTPDVFETICQRYALVATTKENGFDDVNTTITPSRHSMRVNVMFLNVHLKCFLLLLITI